MVFSVLMWVVIGADNFTKFFRGECELVET